MVDVSVITPSLNSAGVINDCLKSVAQQSFKVEHIVVDGHSSDGTVDQVREFGITAKLLQEEPAGIYSAINSGILNASAPIIGVLNADDLYASPGVLEKVQAVFADPSIDACYGDLCYVDQEDIHRVVRYWNAGACKPSSFRNGWMPPHPTFFLRRSMYEKHGLYREDLGTAADYELMLRMLYRHRLKAVYIPSVLVNMRTGGASNASLAARLAASNMDRRAWKVNDISPYPWFSLAKPVRKINQWWRRPKAS